MNPLFTLNEMPSLKPLARVIDDEETVRNSIVFNLRMAGIEAVAYESALDYLENDDNRHAGCVILDVRMPDMSGLELQNEMLRRGIDLPIIFLTGHGDVSMAVTALQKGAADFCEKPVEPERLRKNVRRLFELNMRVRREKFRIDMMRKNFDTLTQREKEIIRLVANDQLNKVIAINLGIQEHTVKIHRANACRKLGVRSALEAHKYLSAIGEIVSN